MKSHLAIVTLIVVAELVGSLQARDPLAGSLWDEHEEQFARKEQKFRGWQHCLAEDALSGPLRVNRAGVTVTADGDSQLAEFTLDVSLAADAVLPEGSTYTLELWHQESGSRIKYLGPYDACAGWLGGQKCPVAQPQHGSLVASVTRTLHKDDGHYEATLQIFGDNKQDPLLCVVVPFQAFTDDAWLHEQYQPKHLDFKTDQMSAEHIDSSVKHLDSSNKHLDSSNKHIDSSNKHPDPSNKHPDPSNKHPDTVEHSRPDVLLLPG